MCGGRRFCEEVTVTGHQDVILSKMLEEKEKDLEIAAEIGQELLERNEELEERVAALETELNAAKETITQLKHEVHVKNDLLEMSDVDMEAEPYITTIFVGQQPGAPGNSINNNKPPPEYSLRREVRKLKEENVCLKVEAEELHIIEEQEKEVIADFSRRLRETNARLASVSDRLSAKSEEAAMQRREISSLRAELSSLREKYRAIEIDLHHATLQLNTTKESENELNEELQDLKLKYSEVLELLHDTQEQVRRYEQLNCTGCGSWPWEDPSLVGRRSPFVAEVFQTDHDVSIVSLAAEMEESMILTGNGGFDDVDSEQQLDDLQKILQTYKAANSENSASEGPENVQKEKLGRYDSLGSSSGASSMSSSRFGSSFGKPVRLQLVKPMKDSEMLQHWAGLALPNFLDGLLGMSPATGVAHKANSFLE